MYRTEVMQKTRWGGIVLLSFGLLSCGGMTHSMDANEGGVDHGAMDQAKNGQVAAEDAGHQDAAGHPDGQHDHHGEGQGHHGEGVHGTLAIPEGQPLPKLQLSLEPDAIKGWNLQLQVENFEFAPERVNQTSLTTEGHAHLYINGKKITRLYGPWYYLSSLPTGDNELRVELNANGHERLAVEGEPIEATLQVTVP